MDESKFLLQSQNYAKSVRKAIERDYGEVPPEWEAQLQQLQDFYTIYLKCADFMKTEDIIVYINNKKTPATNIHYSTMCTCMDKIEKIVKQFGLTPVSRKKLKGSQAAPSEDDDDDYMNSL